MSDFDVIQRAKNPKYTPLRRKRISMGPYSTPLMITSRYSKDEDDIEHQSELFTIHCDAIRLSMQYKQSANGGGGGTESEPIWNSAEEAESYSQNDDFIDADELARRRSNKRSKKTEL